MIVCRLVRRFSTLHAGRELPGALLARLDAHVLRCSPCASRLERAQADRVLVQAAGPAADRAAPEALGDNFWYAIRRELRTDGLVGEEATRRRTAATWSRSPAFGLAVRGVAAAAVIAVALVVTRPATETSGPLPEQTAGAQRPPAAAPPSAAGGGGLVEVRAADGGIERVSTSGPRRGWIDPVEPFGPPAVEYHLEGWQASPERDRREVLDF